MPLCKPNSFSDLPKDIFELLQRRETILKQIDPQAVSLWRDAQRALTEYAERFREPTRKLACWFLHNHLRDIKSASELQKAYDDPVFSDPLLRKWKQTHHKGSYSTAEDVAFFWRLNELITQEE